MLPIPVTITPEELDVLLETNTSGYHEFGKQGAKFAGSPHYFNSFRYDPDSSVIRCYKDTGHLGLRLHRDQVGSPASKIPTDVLKYSANSILVGETVDSTELSKSLPLKVWGQSLWDGLTVSYFTGRPFEKPVIIIDLETLGTKDNSIIIQVGAVFGDLVTGKITATFNEHVTSTTCLNKTRHIDLDTVLWHQTERSEQRTYHSCVPLKKYVKGFTGLLRVLEDFCKWYHAVKSLVKLANEKVDSDNVTPLRIICKGPEFDIKLLENALNQAGVEVPWNYQDVGSVRTYEHLYTDLRTSQGATYREAKEEIREFLKAQSIITHDGLFDAIVEFQLVYEICTILQVNKPKST